MQCCHKVEFQATLRMTVISRAEETQTISAFCHNRVKEKEETNKQTLAMYERNHERSVFSQASGNYSFMSAGIGCVSCCVETNTTKKVETAVQPCELNNSLCQTFFQKMH